MMNNLDAGAAFEDANGFNYGLGIVPWARVGVTANFGPDFGSDQATPTLWEETAYGQGARVSSNSWGLVDPSTFLPITRYDVSAQEYDRIVRDAQGGVPGNQQLAVVFSPGNDGPSENTVGARRIHDARRIQFGAIYGATCADSIQDDH